MKVPILDLTPEIESRWDEYTAAFQSVLKSCQFINGPEVTALEKEITEYLGIKHALGVNSGTDALVIALRAVGIQAGDEVLVPSMTFFATAESISQAGATPIFVDIDPKTFNIDTTLLEKKIRSKTRAILPVHLFGQVAHMDPILILAQKHGLKVVEDCAQAFGSDYKGTKSGTLGNAGAFSFFPSKNLGAFGDGGIITTNDDSVAETCRMLRSHGSKIKYYNEVLGYNSRLDSIQAAILRIKLHHIDKANASRKRAAQRYNEILSNHPHIQIPVDAGYGKHVYHQYTIRITNGQRDKVHKILQNEGIQTMIYYPVPIHKMKAYKWEDPLVETEKAAEQVLSLPIWPEITPEIQLHVAEQIRKAL